MSTKNWPEIVGTNIRDIRASNRLSHNALAKLVDSPAVDMIASPHSYDNRGYGGYHSPQAMADTAR